MQRSRRSNRFTKSRLDDRARRDSPTANGGWRGSAIAQTEPFAIADEAPAPVTITLDETAIAHLRAAVERAKEAPR